MKEFSELAKQQRNYIRMGSDDLFDLLLEYDQSESEFSFYGTAGSYMFECGHHQPIEAMENLYSAHSGAVHAK